MWADSGEYRDLSRGVFNHVNRFLQDCAPPAVELVNLDQLFDGRGDGLEFVHAANIRPGFLCRLREYRMQHELHDRERQQRAYAGGTGG